MFSTIAPLQLRRKFCVLLSFDCRAVLWLVKRWANFGQILFGFVIWILPHLSLPLQILAILKWAEYSKRHHEYVCSLMKTRTIFQLTKTLSRIPPSSKCDVCPWEKWNFAVTQTTSKFFTFRGWKVGRQSLFRIFWSSWASNH